MEFVKNEDNSWLKPEGLQVRPETASNLSWEEAGCFERTSSTPARGQRPRHGLETFIIWAVV